MSFRSVLTATVAVVALVAALHPAQAGIDVAVGNGDKVTGTLLPASEIETFRVNVPAEAVFKLKVKGKAASRGAKKPPTMLRLFDPEGNEVGGEFVKTRKTTATLKGFRAPVTGEYRIEVSGDGQTSGNYLLIVKWTSKKKHVVDLEDTGPGEPSQVPLPFDASSKLKLKFARVKGSMATPIASELIGPISFQTAFDPPAVGAGTHLLKNVTVPEFGVSTIVVSGGGAYRATVLVKLPKPARRKIALTGKDVGGKPFSGGDNVVGKVISPSGGTVGIDGVQSPLVGGSSVFLPVGAVTSPTPILIGESSPMPNQEPGQQGAGPSVFFGPEGLTFAEDVEVTIPWDPDLFGESAEELRVYTRDEDGNVTEIFDFELDVENGTCTFPVSHFSSFRVFGPKLPAPVTGDLDSDGIGDLVLKAPMNGTGVVYIAPGGSLASTDTGMLPVALTGENVGDGFGTVTATGDLNQDGREDLIVSANRAGIAGRVYVFFGGPGPAIQSRSADQADAMILPQQGDLGFGIRLDCGDVNGDEIDDLLIGAEGSSVGASAAGAAYVFYGSPEFSTRFTENADVTLLGKRSNDGFGAAVAIGDVTGDGIADIVVGSEERSVPDTGSVHVFFGGPNLKSKKSHKADFSADGVSTGDRFGLEIAVGDVDGDSIDDVIVASPGDDEGGNLSGAVFVHFGGRLNDPPAKLVGGAPSDDFGFNLTAADLQNDGPLEIIASSGNRAGGRGAVHIFAGMNGFASQGALSATTILSGESPNDVLRVVQQAYDMTGDAFPDLVIYAPGANGDAGRAYVFPGGPTLPASGSAGQAPIVYDGQPGDALGGDPIP